ncbi:MAG TPA: GNAT family N-acetyltransferase [Chthonomonadaceae bacterium]|nr:GNAT family N-acetyltransferase [Chthonomonadaceae bacterium]
MDTAVRIEALRKAHDKSGFDCGEISLNTYLAQYAGQNDRADIGRTFVLVEEGSTRVLGYYTLSAASVLAEHVPDVRTRYPVPVAHLGRLAVDKSQQGKGYGEYLLMDALRRARDVSNEMAVYAVAVDALNEAARKFYLKYGFTELADDRMHLFLPMKLIRKLDLG